MFCKNHDFPSVHLEIEIAVKAFYAFTYWCLPKVNYLPNSAVALTYAVTSRTGSYT